MWMIPSGPKACPISRSAWTRTTWTRARTSPAIWPPKPCGPTSRKTPDFLSGEEFLGVRKNEFRGDLRQELVPPRIQMLVGPDDEGVVHHQVPEAVVDVHEGYPGFVAIVLVQRLERRLVDHAAGLRGAQIEGSGEVDQDHFDGCVLIPVPLLDAGREIVQVGGAEGEKQILEARGDQVVA